MVAPLCAAVLLPAWLYLEARAVFAHHGAQLRRVGVPMLLANASVAFLLNLSTMALIKHTSALTLNVSGVFKDLLLIGARRPHVPSPACPQECVSDPALIVVPPTFTLALDVCRVPQAGRWRSRVRW